MIPLRYTPSAAALRMVGRGVPHLRRRESHLLLHGLDGDLDLHLVADHHHRLERLVEGDAEVGPVDRGGSQEGDALGAPRVHVELAEVAAVQQGVQARRTGCEP
jgi:hypothetical protein